MNIEEKYVTVTEDELRRMTKIPWRHIVLCAILGIVLGIFVSRVILAVTPPPPADGRAGSGGEGR